jgi:uncharacterized protein (DUF3084 family)
VNGCTCAVHAIQPGSSEIGKKTPPRKEIAVTISPAPKAARLNATAAAAASNPNGTKVSAPRRMTGTLSGAVDNLIGMPNAKRASVTVTSAASKAIRNGKIVIERIALAAPNGDKTIRSNVPATSSCRTSDGSEISVEVRTPKVARPTTTNPKYWFDDENECELTRRDT